MGRHIRRAPSGRRLEPSSAKWAGQLWRVERYRAGRADGSPWPTLNSAKRPFGGSLNEAVRAAGFEPAKPGPKRRRDVDPEYGAWQSLLRRDPCACCPGAGGTVDHIEPRCRPARGVGSAHGWVNTIGACTSCNGAKRDRPLLGFLQTRACTAK